MPNVAQALKAEIVRISRKEIKTAVNPLRRSNTALKRSAAELKKKIRILETENKRLSSFHNAIPQQEQESAQTENKLRLTSKGIKKLRMKLGLSQEAFAKLLGVSGQAVNAMEHKNGSVKLRSATLSNLLSVRKIGKREAQKRLKDTKRKK
jgi:DNA-binding transcriptional regulator YiaG